MAMEKHTDTTTHYPSPLFRFMPPFTLSSPFRLSPEAPVRAVAARTHATQHMSSKRRPSKQKAPDGSPSPPAQRRRDALTLPRTVTCQSWSGYVPVKVVLLNSIFPGALSSVESEFICFRQMAPRMSRHLRKGQLLPQASRCRDRGAAARVA